MLSIVHTLFNLALCRVSENEYALLSSTMGVVFHFDGAYLDDCDLLRYLIPCDMELKGSLEERSVNRSKSKSLLKTGGGSASSCMSSLERQSSLFMTLIADTFTHNREDIKQISPSIYALQKCLDAGWVPGSYPPV